MKNEFDDFANEYRKIHTENVQKISGQHSDYFTEYKIREISSFMKDGKIWLDFGCGDGNSARYILKYFPQSKYFGIDVSSESIETAKKRDISSAQFDCYDGEKLPYKDNTFDIVFIACVLHHIPIKLRDRHLKECFRVLKSGGELIVFEQNTINPVTRKIVKDCPFDSNAILLSSTETKKRLKKAGFSDLRIRYTIFFPRKALFQKILLLEKWLYFCPIGGQYYIRGKKGEVGYKTE